MSLINSLTSCIGMNVSQMKTLRQQQGYTLSFTGEMGMGVQYYFRQKFPELKQVLSLVNVVENGIVTYCSVQYDDLKNGIRLEEEFKQVLSNLGIKNEIRMWINPNNGNQISQQGFYLPNGEYFNDYEWSIEKMPPIGYENYIPSNKFVNGIF